EALGLGVDRANTVSGRLAQRRTRRRPAPLARRTQQAAYEPADGGGTEMSNPFLPEKISRSHLDGDTARIIAKIEEEELCNRDLLRKAAPRAWKWARLFDQDLRAGTLVKPGSDASRDVLDGWRL